MKAASMAAGGIVRKGHFALQTIIVTPSFSTLLHVATQFTILRNSNCVHNALLVCGGHYQNFFIYILKGILCLGSCDVKFSEGDWVFLHATVH